MPVVKCKHCGKRISDRETVCRHCGEPIRNNPTSIPEEKKSDPTNSGRLIRCKACGEMISKKTVSCPHCGEPVSQWDHSRQPPPVKQIEEKGIPLWTWLVVGLIVLGFVKQMLEEPKPVKNYDYSKVNKNKKTTKNTLKGGYAACVTNELFDEFISAAVKKDNLAISHLLLKGCIITKAGERFSIIDLGLGTTKIRAYIDGNSVILYTNTENIR